MKIEDNAIIPVFAFIICCCVPSPQSNNMSSPSLLTIIPDGFRFEVGNEPPVPRNVTRSIDIIKWLQLLISYCTDNRVFCICIDGFDKIPMHSPYCKTPRSNTAASGEFQTLYKIYNGQTNLNIYNNIGV